MSASPTGRSPLRVGLPWLWAMMLVVATLLPAVPAQAAELKLEVQLTDVSASGNKPTDVVTVKGTVTNNSGVPLYDVKASLWRSIASLHALATVQNALIADETTPGLTMSAHPSESDMITAPGVSFAPKASREFTLSGTLNQLDITETDAAYWVGANVSGSTAVGGAADATDTARTLVSIPGTTAPTVTSVVELSATPSLIRQNLFADDSLAAELSGRLTTLLQAAASPGMTWVIDPELYAAVVDMADGYQVVDGTSTKPGTGTPIAKEWLAAFNALDQSAGYQTLFGRPDLVGAADARAPQVLARSVSAGKAVGLTLPTLVVLRRVSQPALDSVAAIGAPLLTDALGPGHTSVTIGADHVTGATPLDLPVTSRVISNSMPTDAARSSVLVALTRAAGHQVRLLRTSADVELDQRATPPWVKRQPFGTPYVNAVTHTLPETAAAHPGALDSGTVGLLDQVSSDLDAYGAAAPQAGIAAMADAEASRAASEAWLDDPRGRAAFIAALRQRLGAEALASGIGLSASAIVTLASSESEFPVTVTNHLGDSITVRVGGTTDNPARIQLRPSSVVTVRPNESQTVVVPTRASANGVVGASVHVETPDGRSLTRDIKMSIEATNLGVVGWIIVLVSGLVLVVSTALRIRQVRKNQSRTSQPLTTQPLETQPLETQPLETQEGGRS